MTWTRIQVEDAVGRAAPRWLKQATEARTAQDASNLGTELGWVGYMLEKAHTTNCGHSIISELESVRLNIRMTIERIRRRSDTR